MADPTPTDPKPEAYALTEVDPGIFHFYKVISVDRIVDGDTIYMTVSLGLMVALYVKVRLLGANAPEVRGKEKAAGKMVTQMVKDELRDVHDLVLESNDTGKYGRWLGTIYYRKHDDDEGYHSLNDFVAKSSAAALTECGFTAN